MKSQTDKVPFPISIKLVSIFSILVLIVLGITTYMVSTLVRSDERVKAEENNHTINGRTAETVQDSFLAVQHNAAGLLNTLALIPQSNSDTVQNLFADYCTRNDETIFISGPFLGTKYNPSFTNQHKDTTSIANSWLKTCSSIQQSVKDGTIEVKNISSLFNTPALCVFFPYKTENSTECAAIAFTANHLAEIMSTGSFNTSMLVNKVGDVLIHSDFDKMISGTNIASLSAFQNMIASELDNSQSIFPDENNDKCFYAYHKIIGGMLVITTESEKTVFESIDRTTYRIILFSLAILFLAIFIIRIFSKTITHPIGELVDASHQIEDGQYDLTIKPATRDEIGALTKSFVHMSKGLAERERLRTTFSKFTNKTIAERAMKGELVLGGETRNATVFFSDIRSFTAMSEKLQPQQVVDMLNEYMTSMVACVNKTGGVVDKYIGDSIMAVWGAPESAGTSADDAWNSVQAALLMRTALAMLNKKRTSLGQPAIRIGCGINTGAVVAGQIGSSERMEYTVIGDTVNFASRTESLNKPFATDILVTENTYLLVKDKIIAQEMPAVTVKGKEKPVKMYAVINETGKTDITTIDQLRTFLGVQAPDLEKVDVNEEEKKYKIN